MSQDPEERKKKYARFPPLQKMPKKLFPNEIEKILLSLGEISEEPPKTKFQMTVRRIRNGSYFFAFFASAAFFAIFLIVVFQMLLPNSPYNLYAKIVPIVALEPNVIEYLGIGIKSFTDPGFRGGDNLNFVSYKRPDGVELVRMKFYLKGSLDEGICWAEIIKRENGESQFSQLIPFRDPRINFLYVDVPSKGKRIVLVRNNDQHSLDTTNKEMKQKIQKS